MNRVARLRECIEDNLVIRDAWTGIDKRGRKTACLLAT